MQNIALRIDDIGASTKIHEQYTPSRWLNIGPLKDRRLLGAWGPYREMTAAEWREVFKLLQKHSAKLTVAITAAWVEKDGSLVPFPEKFPEEAQVLKEGADRGLLEIASHGLTHCVLERKAFLPRLIGSNRSAHREFWPWLSRDLHHRNLQRSIEILTAYFGRQITSFVPPGNVYGESTLQACQKLGIRTLNCNNPKIRPESEFPKVIGNEQVIAFHDRELVLEGIAWLERKLATLPQQTQFSFISEL